MKGWVDIAIGFLGALLFAVVLTLGWSVYTSYTDHWRVSAM